MSRSKRHNPIIALGGKHISEKDDKRIANKKFRKIGKLLLDEAPIKLSSVSDNWSFTKDGKIYINKEDEYYIKVIRK